MCYDNTKTLTQKRECFSGLFMQFFVLILVRQLHKTLYIFKVHTPIAALSASGL